jgi:pilus assembly protein CpaF
MAGFELPVPVIRHYISSAVTLVVQIARLKGGARKVVRVAEVLGTDPGPYHTKDIFAFQQTGVADGRAVGEFRATGYVPAFLPRLDAAGVAIKAGLFTERVIG